MITVFSLPARGLHSTYAATARGADSDDIVFAIMFKCEARAFELDSLPGG